MECRNPWDVAETSDERVKKYRKLRKALFEKNARLKDTLFKWLNVVTYFFSLGFSVVSWTTVFNNSSRGVALDLKIDLSPQPVQYVISQIVVWILITLFVIRQTFRSPAGCVSRMLTQVSLGFVNAMIYTLVYSVTFAYTSFFPSVASWLGSFVAMVISYGYTWAPKSIDFDEISGKFKVYSLDAWFVRRVFGFYLYYLVGEVTTLIVAGFDEMLTGYRGFYDTMASSILVCLIFFCMLTVFFFLRDRVSPMGYVLWAVTILSSLSDRSFTFTHVLLCLVSLFWSFWFLELVLLDNRITKLEEFSPSV